MARVHNNNMTYSMSMSMLIMMMIVFVLMMHVTNGQAVTCKQVSSSLSPCLDYVKNGGAPVLPAPCCGGMKSLYAAAKASADRQTVCKCLKTSLTNVKVNADLLGSLPHDCGVNLPYKITPSIDCTTVH